MEIMKTLILNNENRESVFAALRRPYSEELLGELESKVRDIIEQVRIEGDQGLLEITHRLEGNNLKPEELMVRQEEFERAKKQVDPELVKIIEQAIARVTSFHQAQMEKSWFYHQERGMVLGQLIQPLERVGIYVPGGKAEYPSSLIMGAVPALLAGVKEIVVVSPLGERRELSPYLLITAQLLGISRVYKVGGAQAIAALAYGTETITIVNKIVGPGNVYVTVAKKQVFGQVDIDMLAGPSEICIWAEEGANSDYVVADLFSQAEHDEQAYAVLVTTSTKLAQEVARRIEQQISQFPRKEIILSSLTQNGKIIVAENESMIVEFINRFAPEHLELQIDDPWSYLGEIKNFGAVFLGPYAPEPLGDYWAGPNHILPTGGSAKHFSVLSVSDFLKRSSVIYCSREKLQEDQDNIARFADLEGLSAHAYALRIRK
jgi:histidinol dehydrogenase